MFSLRYLSALLLASSVAAHPGHRGRGLAKRQQPPGYDTSNTPRPVLGAIPYGQIIENCNENGVVAITYDDGPGPYTVSSIDRSTPSPITGR